MFSLKAANIYDVVKPIHVCSQLVGLTSFEIRKDNRQRYKSFVTFYNVLCIVASSSWSVFIITRLTFYERIWILDREYLSEFFENCSRIVLFVFMTIIMFVSWWLLLIKDKFVTMLKLIKDVDDTLVILDTPVNHRKQKTISILFLAVAKLANISEIFGIISMSKVTTFYNNSIYSLIGNLIGSESFVLMSTQFIFLMWAIKIRYAHVNDILRRFYSQKRSNLETSPKINAESFQKLSILHDSLTDLANMTSFCYGVPVSRT